MMYVNKQNREQLWYICESVTSNQVKYGNRKSHSGDTVYNTLHNIRSMERATLINVAW